MITEIPVLSKILEIPAEKKIDAYTRKDDASNADVFIPQKDDCVLFCKLQRHDKHKLCIGIEINRHKSSFSKYMSFYKKIIINSLSILM
jgi:hypothetical protein